AFEKHLEGHSIVQVFAGMNFEAEVDSGFIEGVQDRAPAPGKLIERRLYQTGGPLRPRIKVRPGQRARKRRVLCESEVLRSLRSILQLLDRPTLAFSRVASHFGCGER